MKLDRTLMAQDTTFGDLASGTRPLGSNRSFKRAMDRYRPDPLRVLFIAEAPPAYKVNRLFYFHEVPTGDALFLEMMKVIYGAAIGFTEGGGFSGPMSAKDVRKCKPQLLSRFMADGLYLIDASERPIRKVPLPPLSFRFFGGPFRGSRLSLRTFSTVAAFQSC